MTYTTQPPAGTPLATNSINTGLVWARNMADHVTDNANAPNGTLVAGSATLTDISGGVTSTTDANGAVYVTSNNGGNNTWNLSAGSVFGPEYTLMVLDQFVSTGSQQALIDSDLNTPRYFQFFINGGGSTDGTVCFLPFNNSPAVAANFNSTAKVSSTSASVVIARVRYNSGTSNYTASIWIDGVSTGEQAFSGTPPSNINMLGIGNRLGGNQASSSHEYFAQVWNRALSDSEVATLSGDPYSGFNAAAAPAAALAGNATAQATATGTLVGSATAAALSGNATAQASATGALGNVVSFTCDVMINNTNTIYANQTVKWTWYQGGRIGSAPTSVTNGTGTINAGGGLSLSPLPPGAGFGLIAVQGTDATTDAVFYQAGMAA